MTYGDREAAVMQVITERHAHVGLLISILADRDASIKGNISEVAMPVIFIKEILLAIVGDEKIQRTVVVKIGPNGAQAKKFWGRIDSCLPGNIGEGSVVIVVIQDIRRAFEAARAALHVNSAVLTSLERAERGKVLERDIGIMGDD